MADPSVQGHERNFEQLGQGHVAGVVAGEVLPEPPDAVGEELLGPNPTLPSVSDAAENEQKKVSSITETCRPSPENTVNDQRARFVKQRLKLTDVADELAQILHDLESNSEKSLPRQLAHGEFSDSTYFSELVRWCW